MTGLAAAVAVIVSAWNPALFAERSPEASAQRRLGWLLAAAIVVVVTAATESILDLLSVSVPTFRTAAGAVIALVGARWLVGPAPRWRDAGNQLGHGAMDVATPEIVVAAMSGVASDGWALTALGVGLALAASLGLVAMGPTGRWLSWLRRLLGGSAVALGVALIYAGIRAV
ncbi:MAG TPA: hypothetical protein VLG28_00395 [Acidimicrobiia bacterium]|jgi:small neutral amino acid transporter SnatA (MarC family)|nr:hypothetical protein [Acidimicrobiia bacterium]